MKMDTMEKKNVLGKGASCLFALALALAFMPGLGIAPAQTADAAGIAEDDHGYTVEVTGLDDGIEIGEVVDVTVRVTGNPDAKIDDVSISNINLSRNSQFRGDFTPEVTGWIDTRPTGVTTGTFTLKVTVGISKGAFSKTYQFPFTIVPTAPTLRKSDFETTYDSATVYTGRWGYENGDKVEIYSVENGKAVYRAGVLTTDTSDSVTIRGLKANTSYEFVAAGYSKDADGYSRLSKRVTVATGSAKKPAIKSIKVSGAKVKKSKRRWIPGNWSGSHWFPGRYVGGGYYTSFTLKVTLKSRHPGQKGIIVDGKKVSGKGRTFKAKMSFDGKCKGKKRGFSICSYRDADYLGTSKFAMKKVKIK